MIDWRPTATVESLRRRADLLARVRAFFTERAVLEVETPLLSAAAASDPAIELLSTTIAGMPGRFYLNSSPEYPMKRLLAAGSGDIYQICKVFRDAERGRWHNPEFTMIEWYRLGFDDGSLMDEVEALIGTLLAPQRRLAPAERMTYAEALHRFAGVDAHADDVEALTRAAADRGIECGSELDRDATLDLLMGMIVGPRLGWDRPCFIVDYPASQAALARLKPAAHPSGTSAAGMPGADWAAGSPAAGSPGPALPAVAARFELYIDGIELANGFHELVNPVEQRRRFENDLATRALRGQPVTPLDERLLTAMGSGMPDCAGVALGFDRLVAVALGATRLSDAMAFSIDNA